MASVGVAVAAPDMTTSGLLRDADIAMYEAKRAGKSQIKIFDPTMRLSATRHLEFRTELGLAIERDQMRLMFQPMIDLVTGGVVGAEALLRWEHPVRGVVSPDGVHPDRRTGRADRADRRMGVATELPARGECGRAAVHGTSASTCRRCRSVRRTSSARCEAALRQHQLDPRSRHAGDHRDHVRRGDRSRRTATSNSCARSGSASPSTTSAPATARCRTSSASPSTS